MISCQWYNFQICRCFITPSFECSDREPFLTGCYTPLYEKGTEQGQNRSMETTMENMIFFQLVIVPRIICPYLVKCCHVTSFPFPLGNGQSVPVLRSSNLWHLFYFALDFHHRRSDRDSSVDCS